VGSASVPVIDGVGKDGGLHRKDAESSLIVGAWLERVNSERSGR